MVTVFECFCRFLHNTNSSEYKAFRELVAKIRKEQEDRKPEVKPEDRYEPEFSLEDDDSDDSKPAVKHENRYEYVECSQSFSYTAFFLKGFRSGS